MRLKCSNFITLVSMAMLVGTVGLWAAAFELDSHDHHLSVNSSFHIGVMPGPRHSLVGRLVFFNDPDYGPYRGSIVAVTSDGDWPAKIERRWWGDRFGVYYRYFHWLDSGYTLWTLQLSLVYPVLLFAVVPAVWILRRKYRAVAEKSTANAAAC